MLDKSYPWKNLVHLKEIKQAGPRPKVLNAFTLYNIIERFEIWNMIVLEFWTEYLYMNWNNFGGCEIKNIY